MDPEEMIGRRFGRLTVVRPASDRSKKQFVCRCDCGTERAFWMNHLLRGRHASCGCLGIGRSVDAGGDTYPPHKHRLHRIWENMHHRCEKPYNTAYRHYGGRGILVCPEWNRYLPFKEWAITHGYADDLTIDRINPDGNYEPSNCRWITHSENSRRAAKSRWAKQREAVA